MKIENVVNFFKNISLPFVIEKNVFLEEGEEICSKCNGTGKYNKDVCLKCFGAGKLNWIDNITNSERIIKNKDDFCINNLFIEPLKYSIIRIENCNRLKLYNCSFKNINFKIKNCLYLNVCNSFFEGCFLEILSSSTTICSNNFIQNN